MHRIKKYIKYNSKFPHLPTFTYEKTFQDMSNYAATSQISVADYERMWKKWGGGGRKTMLKSTEY